MMRQYTNHQLTEARRLRREMTAAETMLWRGLRNRAFAVKFRRQVPVGPYIAGFLCADARSIVELDGLPHDKIEQRNYDVRRDEMVARAQGWRVFVFRTML